MRILGIDPALRITGIGVIDYSRGRFRLVTSGVIVTSLKQSLPRRLQTVHEEIQRLTRTCKPDAMVLEKVFVHAQHPATAFVLGQARGAICLACAQAGLPLIEYTATQVKKAVTGNGGASKSQVQRAVVALLGLSGTPRYTDVTDALALALTFAYKSQHDLTPVRRTTEHGA